MKHERLAAMGDALAALGHPVAITIAGMLLLNALVLQRTIPSWWTGKVGDFVWVAVVSLLVNASLAVIFPLTGEKHRHVFSLVVVGGFFILMKTSPWMNQAVSESFRVVTGSPAKLVLDPTDLLALPGLLIAWWIWEHPVRRVSGYWKVAALGVVSLALVADAAAPQVMGVTCIVEDSGVIKAYYETIPSGYSMTRENSDWKYYPSSDGGVTWAAPTQLSKEEKAPCGEYIAWPMQDPYDTANQIYYVSGQGLYNSTDGGQNLILDYKTESMPVYDVLVDSLSGNLLFANGTNGVIVRTPAGEWSVVQVGPSLNQ
jgi:hypothetical protein